MDSDLFPTVAWPSLRIWTDDGTGEQIYFVDLRSHATFLPGSYTPATVQFTLGGSLTTGDYIGFAFLSEHYSYQILGGDSLASALGNLVSAVNAFSTTMVAAQTGATVTLTYGRDPSTSTYGANANRIGVYTYVQGSTEGCALSPTDRRRLAQFVAYIAGIRGFDRCDAWRRSRGFDPKDALDLCGRLSSGRFRQE